MTTSAERANPPDQRALARSPLINVIWQVRFTPTPTLSDGRTALQFKELLDRETTLAPIPAPQVAFQVVAGGMPQPDQSMVDPSGQGWRLSAKDGSTHVTLSPTSLAVETTQYGTWRDHFYPWIEAAINALTEAVDPAVVLRVGMRYINALFGAAVEREPFPDASGLRNVVVPPLLGFILDDDLGAGVDAFQGRHLLRIGGMMSHIQHALVTADSGEVGLLLDIDTYFEQTAVFDQKDVLNTANTLHLHGLSVFQRCVTPAAWQAMGPADRVVT